MIKNALLAEYDHEMATTRKLLARLPEDRLAWKPHPRSMSLAGLGTHLANLPNWTDTILNQTSLDLPDTLPHVEERASRADILAAFDDATRRARLTLDKTDAEYSAMWTLKRSGQEMFSVPRVAAFRSFVLNHMIHHRGQLSVYLRLNDVPLPPIYGPTADEG